MDASSSCQSRKRCSDNPPLVQKKPRPAEESLQQQLERCYPLRCLCSLQRADFHEYLEKFKQLACKEKKVEEVDSEEQLVLGASCLAWIGDSCHEQLVAGRVCPALQAVVAHLLSDKVGGVLFRLLSLIKASRGFLRYAACQAVSALLPLSYCGQDVALDASQFFLQAVSTEIARNLPEDQPSLLRGHTSLLGGGEATATSLSDLAAEEVGGLGGLDFDEDEGTAGGGHSVSSRSCGIEEGDLGYQAALLGLLSSSVVHGGGGVGRADEAGDLGSSRRGPGCVKVMLEEDQLCQETQIKCLLLRIMEPVWNRLVARIILLLSTTTTFSSSSSFCSTSFSSSSSLSFSEWDARSQYVLEGLRLWKCLISIRANINFVESRNFAGNLSACVHSLQAASPASVWRAVMDVVSECLCYGTTLGLQSVPPEEPCQLAHTLIRLVRFDQFLSRVPHKQSLGFGGQAGGRTDDDYDRGLVQKIILVLLKCVALTTREARVESSSGESDSSLSSRESGSSCSSDIIIIERNMVGMFKQLDIWVKRVLPVLPYSTLQDSVLHLLQEQDDFLIEGLLCLLDTHIALHVPAREPIDSLLDINPTRGFIRLLSIVSRDSSVLLDFLVSNETCFLLYLLRYLKFIVKDWTGFVETCGDAYEDTVGALLHLKTSINKLMKKSLFPYNISPVYRLLERINMLALNKA